MQQQQDSLTNISLHYLWYLATMNGQVHERSLKRCLYRTHVKTSCSRNVWFGNLNLMILPEQIRGF